MSPPLCAQRHSSGTQASGLSFGASSLSTSPRHTPCMAVTCLRVPRPAWDSGSRACLQRPADAPMACTIRRLAGALTGALFLYGPTPHAGAQTSAAPSSPAPSVRPWTDPSPHQVRRVTVARDVQLEVLDWGGS